MSTTLAASPNVATAKQLPNRRLFQYHHGNGTNPDHMLSQQPMQTQQRASAVPPTPTPTIPAASGSSSSSSSSSTVVSVKKTPNWAEFYKNGYPTEVIVISDSEDEDVKEHDVILTSACPSSVNQARNGPPGTKRKRLSVTPPISQPKRACPPVKFWPASHPVYKTNHIHVPRVFDRMATEVGECDDKDGHLIIEENTKLADGRFLVRKVLGQGTFGKVVSAYDVKTKTLCAVKIIRAVPKYRDASKIELRVLSTLAMYDRKNKNRCIHLRECFDYKNHICIVTDLLGMSIYDFLKSNKYLPFPASHVQSFARQLLSSVAYLHDLNLVHTDLKPENILLRDNSAFSANLANHSKYKTRKILEDTSIHLIDFGSAVFDDEYHNSVVSTRHYRAPEIILGTGWSFPCDIWSIGCILVEMCTGEALFQTHDNLEHLALMQRVIGRPIDRSMLRRASQNSIGVELLNSSCKLNYPNSATNKNSEKRVRATRTLSHTLKGVQPYIEADATYWALFLDLLSKIFVYEPSKRITALEALAHPWITTAVLNVNGPGS